jgi:preprotein translocase subunit YajC
MLPMLAICYLIFYFMVIRPQETKNKQHKALLESIKRGDTVVTTSGMVAKVAGVEKDHVLLEIAPNVKGEPQKSKAA